MSLLVNSRCVWLFRGRLAGVAPSSRMLFSSGPTLLGPKDKDSKGGKDRDKDKKSKKEGKEESRWPKQWPREILHKDLEAAVTPRLTTLKDARRFLKRLQEEERQLLLVALTPKKTEDAAATSEVANGQQEDDAETVRPPTLNELYHLALHQSLPFIGFGFLDNLIMILAGDYIDHTLGAALGITTMAAAGLGNAISDVFGIGSAWYVERWTSRLGVRPPPLTIEQLELSSARLAANIGRALGVATGCVIGMAPLLFI